MQRFLALIEKPHRWNVLIIALALLGSAWIWQAAGAASGSNAAGPRLNSPAPDFTLPTIAGEEISLAALRGHVVVVNLWTAWCPPCREEMPALEQVYQTYRAEGLVVLGVNSTSQDSEEAAVEFVRQLELTFPILLDRKGEVSRRYRLQALPTTYFVDREGIVRDLIVGGPMPPATIEGRVTPLLAEPFHGNGLTAVPADLPYPQLVALLALLAGLWLFGSALQR